jgi:hypothetical protein
VVIGPFPFFFQHHSFVRPMPKKKKVQFRPKFSILYNPLHFMHFGLLISLEHVKALCPTTWHSWQQFELLELLGWLTSLPSTPLKNWLMFHSKHGFSDRSMYFFQQFPFPFIFLKGWKRSLSNLSKNFFHFNYNYQQLIHVLLCLHHK